MREKWRFAVFYNPAIEHEPYTMVSQSRCLGLFWFTVGKWPHATEEDAMTSWRHRVEQEKRERIGELGLGKQIAEWEPK